ncbi:hypothetical protein BGX33_002491 [Mortierella sp. NVP41]|nr:hypothetical protein BGX33_002491 [Mortierella sp. NVP41]
MARARENGDPTKYVSLKWHDYMSIISGVVLFVTYLYSLWGKTLVHKYIRAFLVLIPTVMLLYYSINFMVSLINARDAINNMHKERFGDEHESLAKFDPFTCESRDQVCLSMNSHIFLGLIAGVFALVEVAMSLFMSPIMVKTLAILASASLVATIAYYGHFGRVIAQARENGDLVEEYAGLEWQDYMSIISGVVLFVTYLYSLWGKTLVHKCIRAFLVLIPTVMLLYLSISALVHLIEFWDSAKRLRERYNPNFDDYFVSHNPFSCGDSSDYQYCLAMNSNISIGLIAGVFALVEVTMSLFMSPMKVKTVDF